MNFLKYTLLFLVIIATPFLQATDNNQRVIAFAQDTMKNDFRKAQVFEVRDAVARHPNLSFVYSDAEAQTSLMIRQIEKFIKARVDLLIIGTGDENAVVPVVTKAHNAGIPVIILDRGVNTKNYTTFINSDNIEIGAIGAKYIAERLKGNGLVLLFEGLQAADVTQLRSKGFIDEMAKHPGIKIIKRTGNYLRKDALLEMEKLVKQGIKVDAIFSESDSMLSGVRMVLNRHKIDPSSIIMVGCDYTSEAQAAIRNGSQSGSVLFPLGGDKSVETALKIFAGEKVPHHIINPVKLVTDNNVEEVKPIF
ncbi:MAG: substrate-binding domain-containing protein [Gammaproteobacteria bacterium]|nr:substrate-binding domain-containing protein [Gammaproteobacteria bacterium]